MDTGKNIFDTKVVTWISFDNPLTNFQGKWASDVVMTQKGYGELGFIHLRYERFLQSMDNPFGTAECCPRVNEI